MEKEKVERIAEKKTLDFFETWARMQREFMENWVKSQKEFMENWLQAARKLQESFLSETKQTDTPGKEVLNMYNSWFNTMVNSSKVFTEEALKIQESWKTTVEKQMLMGRDIFKSFSEYSGKPAGRA